MDTSELEQEAKEDRLGANYVIIEPMQQLQAKETGPSVNQGITSSSQLEAEGAEPSANRESSLLKAEGEEPSIKAITESLQLETKPSINPQLEAEGVETTADQSSQLKAKEMDSTIHVITKSEAEGAGPYQVITEFSQLDTEGVEPSAKQVSFLVHFGLRY